MSSELPAAVFIALTNPLPGKEDEYNDWYNHTHLREVVAIEGFLAARRYRLADAQMIENQPYQYLAIYQVKPGAAKAVIENLAAGIPSMTMAPVIDLENGGGFLAESISGTVWAQDRP